MSHPAMDEDEEHFYTKEDRELALHKENLLLRQEIKDLGTKYNKALGDLVVALDAAAYRQMLLACRPERTYEAR